MVKVEKIKTEPKAQPLHLLPRPRRCRRHHLPHRRRRRPPHHHHHHQQQQWCKKT